MIEKKRNNFLSLTTQSQPYLISIDEALPSATNGVSIYPLELGKTMFGSTDNFDPGNCNEFTENNILLFGANVNLKQCCLTRLDDKCYILPLAGYCQLNDEVLNTLTNYENEVDGDSIDLGIELNNGDLILLGDNNLFIFNNPCQLNDDSFNSEYESGTQISLSYLMRQLPGRISNKSSSDSNPLNDEIEALKNRLRITETQLDENQIRIEVKSSILF